MGVSSVHNLNVDVTGCASQQDVRNRVLESVAGLEGFARVFLNGELAPDIDFRSGDISLVSTGLESLVVEVGGLHAAYDFDLISQEETVRGEFVREVTGQDMPEDEKRRIPTTGLRALDGRDDLEVV